MTITSDQIVAIAGVLGALAAIYAIVSKPFKTIEKMSDDIGDLTKSVGKIEKAVELHGDMIAELLEHSIDGNNTGKMKAVKKKFDETYRHDIGA